MRRLTMSLLAICLVLGCDDKNSADDDTSTTDTTEVTDTSGDTAVDPTEDEPASETGCSTASDCDDTDPCTEDICDTGSGDCSHEVMDADDDGYPAVEVDGTDCGGTDCDDTDDTVFQGSDARICAEDADCNGVLDADNDDDGHDSIACGGDDCQDDIAEINPGMTPGCGDDITDPMHDLDCNGNVDRDNDDDGYESICSGATGDCDDSRADTHQDADEVCNDGFDQDCDTIVDGLMLMGSTVPLTTGFDYVLETATVWAGSQFAVAYQGSFGTLRVHYCDTAGVAVGSDIVFGDVTWNALQLALTWTGSEVAVVWSDDRSGDSEIYMARVSPAGTLVGSDVRLTNAADYSILPSPVWSGSEIGIAWTDSRDADNEIYFNRYSPDGTPVGSDLRITNSVGTSASPSLVWTGSEYGLGWVDNRGGTSQLYLSSISPDGVKTTSDIQLTTGMNANSIELVWTGSEWAFSVNDHRDMLAHVYLRRFSYDGTEVGSEVRVSDGSISMFSEHTMVWNGSTFGIAWTWEPAPFETEVVFTHVGADGTELGSDMVMVDTVERALQPDLEWTGSAFGLIWAASDISTPNLQLSTLSYCD